MSVKCDEESTGNSEQDWEIFDVLCKDIVEPACGDHLTHSLDLVTTLRSELAASTYKRDRLIAELSDTKSSLSARDSECETLRAQTARQSALISSLQSRLQATEHRERNLQTRSEAATQLLQREKRSFEEKNKELVSRNRRLEGDLATEETHREQARCQLQDLVRRLCLCLGIDPCESNHLTPETVVAKATDVVAEVQRLRTKLGTTSETLHGCEAELLNTRTTACSDKQRLQAQVEALQALSQDLENRSRQAERDLQITRDRLTECDVSGNKLREELRGFESRCCRLQNNLDRFQNDRLQFLRNVASILCVPEPCETLIKDKIREILTENQSQHSQIVSMREQIAADAGRHREAMEATTCRLRTEESQKCSLEERLEKAHDELQKMKAEHCNLSDYLVRLSRALSWSECTSPPEHGTDTTVLAETLLERAERLSIHHDNHIHSSFDKHHADHHHTLPTHHHSLKLRRERSCHDIPLKESTAMYSLQRRVRVLREQVQRRDLHLELLRRKLALLEDGARGKSIALNERDEALNRARRTTKQAEKTAQQLIEAKAQLSELKSQLADAADYKIAALERARKIEDLQTRIADMEGEKANLITQLASYKTRARSAVECSNDKGRRDEQTIHNLREELSRIKVQLSDLNHRLAQLQAFRSSVGRLLHLRDIPHGGILQRLQTLCLAHQEFTTLSRRYDTTSPLVNEHPCPRFDELVPPTTQCRPLSSSSIHMRRFDDSGMDDHFDDEFEFHKKF
ncbi:hypothetical protein HA402_004985 [Bradysia odoriphaga]|nr:hypothetical protein HA402_004985 [Bradysia odoriphaga]